MDSDSQKILHDLLAFRDDAYDLAVRMVGLNDAEDVVQEAYLRATRTKIQAGWDMRKWFLWLVSTTAKDWHRHERRLSARERKVRMAAKPEELDKRSEPASETAALKETLAAALQNLEEQFRVSIALRYEQGLSYAEAAQVLETPESTLRANVSRGLEKLREILSRQGYAVAPTVIVGTLGEGLGIKAPASLTAALTHIAKTGQLPAKAATATAKMQARITRRATRRAAKAQSGSSGVFVGAAIAAAAVIATVALFANSSRPVKIPPAPVAVAPVTTSPAPIAPPVAPISQPAPVAPPAAPRAIEPKSAQEIEHVDGEIIFQDDFENGFDNFEFWTRGIGGIPSSYIAQLLNGISNPISPQGPNQTKVLLVDTLADKNMRTILLKKALKMQPLVVEFDWMVDKAAEDIQLGFVALCSLSPIPTEPPPFTQLIPLSTAGVRKEVDAAEKRWLHCRSEWVLSKNAAGQDTLLITTSNDGRIYSKITGLLDPPSDFRLGLISILGLRVAIDNVVVRKRVPKVKLNAP